MAQPKAATAAKKFISYEEIPNPRLPKQSIFSITFHDPESFNAWSLRAARELSQLLKQELSTASGLIFRSKGRVFCSGGQLNDYASMKTKEDGISVNREIRDLLQEIELLRIPTTAIVHGDCFGGGIELVSSFDRLICTPSVLFGFWQRRLGLSYGWGGGRRIQSRIGQGLSRSLLNEGAQIPAAKALEIGLVDQLCRASDLENEALRYILEQSLISNTSRGRTKSWTAKRETEIFESLWWAEEHREALARRKKN
jgi:enoyl-CoA hydratase